MIAGPHVYLCDGCVERAARQLMPHRPQIDAGRRRFCRQPRVKDSVTRVGSATVCADFLGLMEIILEYRRVEHKDYWKGAPLRQLLPKRLAARSLLPASRSGILCQ